MWICIFAKLKRRESNNNKNIAMTTTHECYGTIPWTDAVHLHSCEATHTHAKLFTTNFYFINLTPEKYDIRIKSIAFTFAKPLIQIASTACEQDISYPAPPTPNSAHPHIFYWQKGITLIPLPNSSAMQICGASWMQNFWMHSMWIFEEEKRNCSSAWKHFIRINIESFIMWFCALNFLNNRIWLLKMHRIPFTVGVFAQN